MSLLKVFDVAGSGLSAQSVRLNTTASNLANASSTASKPEDVYRARHPVFQAMLQGVGGDANSVPVQLQGIHQSNAPAQVRHEPGHPMADENGNVYSSNVNVIEEMANMISASRSYETNVEIITTSKDLLMRTLNMGR